MKVLAVGGGAREHAIVAALVRAGADVFACLKNKNPGICKAAKGYTLVDESDVLKVIQFAKASAVELAIIGPETPLEVGLADGLWSAGIPTASPSKSAARIETSKCFMRELLARHKVKGSIRFAIVDTTRDLELALDELGMNVVVKPTGLTGGKGVKVVGEHLMTKQDILAYGAEILSKNIGGNAKIVLEEKLVGERSATGGEWFPCQLCRTTSAPTRETRDRTRAGWGPILRRVAFFLSLEEASTKTL
jgi:phosphoribosylamine--glycine ligase